MEKTQSLKARRRLIDLLAETRSRAVRVALFGTLIHRADPDNVETETDTAAQIRVLRDTVGWIERVAVLLTTFRDPWDEFPQPVCTWLRPTVDDLPDLVTRIEAMHRLSQLVADAAETSPGALGQALRAHYADRRDGFMDLITDACEHLWARMAAERGAEVSQARQAGDAVTDALNQMEKIAKHVRLVSLNASVEAARVGEQGAGLGVIAAEFKRLAEEIQGLSQSARGDITALVESSDQTGEVPRSVN